MFSYALKTIKYFILIMNVSLFIGLFWWILCVFHEDFHYDVNFAKNPDLFDNPKYQDNFMYDVRVSPSGLRDEPFRIVLASMYFAFTSLSTVGFGDYHAINDIERVFGAFIILFGVAIFSIIM